MRLLYEGRHSEIYCPVNSPRSAEKGSVMTYTEQMMQSRRVGSA